MLALGLEDGCLLIQDSFIAIHPRLVAGCPTKLSDSSVNHVFLYAAATLAKRQECLLKELAQAERPPHGLVWFCQAIA